MVEEEDLPTIFREEACKRFAELQCQDFDLLHISQMIAQEENSLASVGACLRMSREVISEVEKDESCPMLKDKMHKILLEWQWKNTSNATWANLIKSLQDMDKQKLMECIQTYLSQKEYPMEGTQLCGEHLSVQETTPVPSTRKISPASTGVLPFTNNAQCHNTPGSPTANVAIPSSDGPLPLSPQSPTDALVSGLSQSPQANANPLNIPAVNPDVRRKTKLMEESFASLLLTASIELRKLGVAVDEVVLYLTSLTASTQADVPLFDQYTLSLLNESSMNQVFTILSRTGAISFLNVRLLQLVVMKFGNQNLKDQVKKYGEEVNQFMKETKFTDFLRIWSGQAAHGSVPNCHLVIAKLDREWPGATLSMIADMENFLDGEFHLNAFLFRFTQATPGCVSPVWLNTASATQVIKEATQTKTNIQELNFSGNSIHETTGQGDLEAVQQLIGEGTEINVRDEDGVTPLHVAAERGHTRIMEYLVSNGADINIQDKNGQTPMHTAAKNGNEFIMKSLVKLGADINIKDNDGRTPLDVTVERGYGVIEECFQDAGISEDMYHISSLERDQGTLEKTDTIKAIQLGFQFIDPVEILPCDKYGCDYYNSRHDVELRIPEGAILPNDGMIKIEFGVAMYGPFKLSVGMRVSPVVWLCVQQDDFSGFQKDVEITIPHFVDFSTKDAYTYLRFLKADHQFEDGEIEYQLKPLDGRAVFNRTTHGTLLTRHFCSVCIASKVPLPNEHTKYYLGGGMSLKAQEWQIVFYVCYFLPSCIRTIEQQLDKDSKLIYPTRFMFADGKELMIKFQNKVSGWQLAMESSNKISAKEVDFQKISEEELQLLEAKKLYPPRFVITITGSNYAENSLVSFIFEGATQEIAKEISLNKAIDSPRAPPSIVYPRMCLESVDGTNVLDEEDLRDVRSAVADLARSWKDLGISLGIRLSELDTITSSSPSDCLREMLGMWLKQNYNVERFKEPTWSRLVEAVKDDTGGKNPALAQTIANNHPGR